MRGFLLLVLGAATLQSTGGDKTITKVVKLLQGMLDKSKVDGKSDQTAYAGFKCYCDKTTEEKDSTVTMAVADIERMEAFLEDKRAENAKLSQEVYDLKKGMDENEAARASAKTMRENENADFLTSEADMETGIDQMDRAIQLLQAVGADMTISGQADNEQLMAADATAAAGGFVEKTSLVGSVDPKTQRVRELSGDITDALRAASLLLDPAGKDKMEAFLQAPGNYNAQSGEIVGVLKSMNDTFTSNLESARQEETKAQEEYDEIRVVKETEFTEMETAYNSKKDIIGDNADDISSTMTSLDASKTLRSEAAQFLEDLTARCANKEKEYNKRKTLRANEEAAVAEAISILHSDAARDTFGTVDATSTGATEALVSKSKTMSVKFLQLASRVVHSKGKVSHGSKAVMATLIAKARALHSPRIAAIATSLAAENPFDKVLEQIRKMITLIDDEEAADVTKKGWCETTQSENNANLADKVTDIGTLTTNIDNLKIALDSTNTNIETAVTDLTSCRDSQKTEVESRKAENVQFRTNLANLQEASKILKKATAVLKKYYEYLHAATGAHSYTEQTNTDSGGAQIKRLAGASTDELKKACSELPECMGFNSDGWLKSELAPEGEWYDAEGTNLFVKTFEEKAFALNQEEPGNAAMEGEPDTWDSETEGQKEAGHGVVGMLEYIAEQTKAETDLAIDDERSAQAQFETNMRALTESETTLGESIQAYKSVKAEKEKEIEEAHENKAVTQREHDAIVNYLAQIEPHCAFYITNYETRAANRVSEKAALEGAITTLEGTPAFNAAEANQEKEDLGDCAGICNDKKDTMTAECQACIEGVSVFGYCSQDKHADSVSGCDTATATGSADEMNAKEVA